VKYWLTDVNCKYLNIYSHQYVKSVTNRKYPIFGINIPQGDSLRPTRITWPPRDVTGEARATVVTATDLPLPLPLPHVCRTPPDSGRGELPHKQSPRVIGINYRLPWDVTQPRPFRGSMEAGGWSVVREQVVPYLRNSEEKEMRIRWVIGKVN
jgi:hypothetical protein